MIPAVLCSGKGKSIRILKLPVLVRPRGKRNKWIEHRGFQVKKLLHIAP
jgi:hypothetical protein